MEVFPQRNRFVRLSNTSLRSGRDGSFAGGYQYMGELYACSLAPLLPISTPKSTIGTDEAVQIQSSECIFKNLVPALKWEVISPTAHGCLPGTLPAML